MSLSFYFCKIRIKIVATLSRAIAPGHCSTYGMLVITVRYYCNLFNFYGSSLRGRSLSPFQKETDSEIKRFI